MDVGRLVLPFIFLCVVTLFLLISFFNSTLTDMIKGNRAFPLQAFYGKHRLERDRNVIRFIQNEDNRTLEDLIPRLTPPVMLSMTNTGYMTLAENMIASVTRLNLKYDIVLICEDDTSFQYFQDRTDIFVLKTNFLRNISKPQAHRSELFEQLVSRKAFYVTTLAESGIDVFYVDSDVVFLQDPNPHLRFDFDIIAFDEPGIPHCPGIFYMRSTEASRRMLLKWKYFLSAKEENQIAFNKAMFLTDGFTITRFDQDLFVRGDLYFEKRYSWKKRKPLPVLIHYNDMHDPLKNIERLKRDKLWYIGGSDKSENKV